MPHAGWMFSGRLAAMTIKAVASSAGPVELLVLFGADHQGVVGQGEVYDSGVWRTPLGEVEVDAEAASALLEAGGPLRANPEAHAMEHSLEVQVPLIQVALPAARIVPIAVPPTELAVQVGQAVGRTLAERFPGGRVIGSTDLTHHGGHFGSPGGRGSQGLEWSENNDRRMLDLLEAIRAEDVIGEARARSNACGAGAIAATIAACARMGARRGLVLEYTNSYRVIREIYPSETDETTVGYVSAVFG